MSGAKLSPDELESLPPPQPDSAMTVVASNARGTIEIRIFVETSIRISQIFREGLRRDFGMTARTAADASSSRQLRYLGPNSIPDRKLCVPASRRVCPQLVRPVQPDNPLISNC